MDVLKNYGVKDLTLQIGWCKLVYGMICCIIFSIGDINTDYIWQLGSEFLFEKIWNTLFSSFFG